MHSAANPFKAHGLEKLRILARLTAGPATDEQLKRDCQSDDPSASVQALRQQGHNITSHRLHRIARDGTVARVGLYVLRVNPTQRAALRSE